MKVLSLFSGICGFDLGFERAGMETVAFCEPDKFCRQLIRREYPDKPIYYDIRTLSDDLPKNSKFDVICGGDPCQCRSVAKGGGKSSSPDLSGYFLLLAAKCTPRWIIRENVPAHDVVYFARSLRLLGYGVVVVELDARDFTAQSRRRQFVVGCFGEDTATFKQAILAQTANTKIREKGNSQKSREASACITAHPNRLEPTATYCYEPEHGIRVLTAEEREALQGFPRGWTSGFSWSRRCVMLGNAVPPPMVEFIGRAILEAEKGE